jgi:hypothetical protein
MKKEKHFVAFLDILGFKNLVTKNDEDKIAAYFEISNVLVKSWNDTLNKKSFKFYNFSDSIVVLVPFSENKDETAKLFKHLCIALAELQFHLCKKNIWLRGAISFGEMTLEESQKENEPQITKLYGKPLIRAYELESGVAKYPRIILDSELIGEMGFTSAADLISETNKGINFSNWKGDVLFRWPERTDPKIARDVSTFIDYFDYLFQDLRASETHRFESMVEMLRDCLYKNQFNHDKYRWLVDYLITKCEMNLGFQVSSYANFSSLLNKI